MQVLANVFHKVAAKVENKRYMAIIVSDFRHGSKFYPFHSDLYQLLCNKTIKLVGVTILEQPHKRLISLRVPVLLYPKHSSSVYSSIPSNTLLDTISMKNIIIQGDALEHLKKFRISLLS